MKPLISPEYKKLNEQLHEEHEKFGRRGSENAATIVKICKTNGYKTVLDFGCGKGGLKPAVAKIASDIRVFEFDPAIKGKDRFPDRSIDFVVALDVMEHIEPEFLDSALAAMAGLTPKQVLFLIALKPANKTLPDGRNAHLIIESPEWWMKKVTKYFRHTGSRTFETHLQFSGVPI